VQKARAIRCAKCQVQMSVRQFVAHRTGNGAPCQTVPCAVCGGPVRDDATVAREEAVCSPFCAEKKWNARAVSEAFREVDDQLAAMRRAEILPPVYQRVDHPASKRLSRAS
jgi:hypothetical protein